MKPHDLVLLTTILTALTSCESTDSNATYERAMNHQAYEQDLHQYQTMMPMFQRSGGIVPLTDALYALPQSR